MSSSVSTSSVLSVSQLNNQVRQLLENQIGEVWLQGEISNLAKPYSGHWYFSLKDNKAQVRCAMFKGQNRRVLFDVQDGQQVLVRARISVYEPRGEYQLIAQSIQPAGHGAMQLAYEQLKCRLAAEGLFAEQNKRALPDYISRVGVITSASGAAFADITAVLSRLAPTVQIVLYPSQVQGESAPQELLQALALANQRDEVDLLIIGRGGGSLEDLWAFNHEALVRALADSSLPTISAVGHEVDTTLCDFVADWRAPTPSAAAERVAAHMTQLSQRIDYILKRLEQAIKQTLSERLQTMTQLERRLKLQSPEIRLQLQQQRLDELTQRLERASQLQWTARQQHLAHLSARLNLRSTEHRLNTERVHINQLKLRLEQSLQQTLTSRQAQLSQLSAQLHALSPLATLARGYTSIQDEQGTWVTHADQLELDKQIQIQFQDGKAKALVTQITPNLEPGA